MTEQESGIQFGVLQSAVVMRPKSGRTLSEATPAGITKVKAEGANPALLDTVEGANVAAVGGGVMMTLSALATRTTLPDDRILNAAARDLGAANPNVTHRKTEFGDTAVQRYVLPVKGFPEGMLTVQTMFVVDKTVWSLAASGPPSQAEAAYELATATLSSSM